MPRRPVPAVLLALSMLLPAQEAALGDDEAKVRWVAGRPLVRATLRAGEQVYFCHLLVDLATRQGLYLHRNAGGTLRASACDVEFGGIALRDVAFTARRDEWLEGLTAEFAEELQQVPVAGILGLPAFGERDLVLDGPAQVIRVLPATPATAEPPPRSRTLAVVPLTGSLADGLRLRADLGAGVEARLSLHSRDPFSWIDPELARRAGQPDGVLARCLLAPGFDAAAYTPFRPLRAQSGDQGGLGGEVLQQLALTVQPAAQRLLVGLPAAPAYPAEQAAFYRAAFGGGGAAALREFLAGHPEGAAAAEAARLWLAKAKGGGDRAELEAAGLAVVRTAKANGRATAALEVLRELPGDRESFALRRAIAAAGLADARQDEDGTAGHQLHLELGMQLRRLGDAKGARRHLLSAVFGMPTSGPANLELGHWHRDQGELDAALGRYFLAMLDARATGQQGYAAFAAAFAPPPGGARDLLAELADRADGRVPAFQPIRREPGSWTKTGRTVLVELFTGAMCPPCVAADVAGDALGEYFDADEAVVLQWHLPIPAPEPLVSPAAQQRAERHGVGSTPVVLVGGQERIEGGGKADAAPELFQQYRAAVDRLLGGAPVAAIAVRAAPGAAGAELAVEVAPAAGQDPAAWRVHVVLAEALVAFPGRNGLLLHQHVARAALTPPGGAPCGGPLALVVDLPALGRELDAHVAQFEAEGPFLVRPVAPDPRRLEVVAWVEDARGAVLQAVRQPLGGPAK